MSILKSKTYIENINKLIQSHSFFELKDKTFFITGCNGLICSAIIDVLIILDKQYNLNIKIYLATRNIEKTYKRFSNFSNTNIEYIQYDAIKDIDFSNDTDYYIHGASPASPDLYVSFPVETMLANIIGIKNILENSRRNKSKVLYISSSEVYGKIQSLNPIPEEYYGELSILNKRSSYSQSKRASETLCTSYISEYNSDVVIARPGHIYGPTASKSDIRVSSQFMYDAAAGKDLVLKSKGEQLRSYTYCLDCASALLTILLKGKTGEAYNISNPNSIISIAQMAQYFAEFANVKLRFEIPDEEEKKAFNPMNNSSLDSTKLELLGWKPVFSKEEGFKHSIEILKELNTN